MIHIGTLNVRSGRNANLDCALRGSKILGIDIIVLTETKIDNEKYTQYLHGYKIHTTKAVSKSQGGGGWRWLYKRIGGKNGTWRIF
jgi:hypothetical protein